ncbi:TPA: hypothetical protein N0F65_003820 [Lagenidium giganteum]|uniref:Uncharacterized protein n=1 Tax=Lagenidium giganteum TaxID=4803 RepID=A0AAV2YVC7_9STRA|nr:TPA: hypothetical protein N0F65_003820 [Lagenidium giganteum]
MDEESRLLNRYVRPIYDAIDNRQYKSAIKLCQHKKVAHLDIVQVLRAHCLERIGRVDEALDICRAVQKKKPTDDTLLNTMFLVFRLAGCEHEMLPTFEYACSHGEPNEELLQSLFFAYVRKGDLLKQQQTALKMFKAFNSLKHMCWASLSMMLQVEHGGAPVKMLALAEKMLQKTLRESKKNDGEALQLLLQIIELQSKPTDALAAFDEFANVVEEEPSHDDHHGHGHGHGHGHSHGHGESCSHGHDEPMAKGRAAEGEGVYEEDIELGPMQTIDKLSVEAGLAKAAGDWARCVKTYETLLQEHNADDWTFLKEYTNARFHMNQDLAAVETELTKYFAALQAAKGNEKLRGPRLILVHLQSELLEKHREQKAKPAKIQEAEQTLVQLILAYIEQFYSKTCCFSDLKAYLQLEKLSPATRKTFVDKIRTMFKEAKGVPAVSQSDEERAAGLNRLNRRLLALKILCFVGEYSESRCSIADLEELVVSLVNEYEVSSWMNLGSTGGQREVQYTDDLLLLAANLLLAIYQRAPTKRNVLFEAAALLEYGLEKSSCNFQMKILLCRVYAYLGACEAMLKRHEELDVKHIQLDSLSFLVFDKMLALCHFPEAQRLCESIARLHRSSASETPEYITRSYRFGVYTKVIDMTDFLHKKMEKSHTLAMARTELENFGLTIALANGPSKLHELLVSAEADTRLKTIDDMLASELSSNQHREVTVHWFKSALVGAGDSFPLDNSALVEVDRSANFESSIQWMKLYAAVQHLLRAVALGDHASAATSLEQYKQHVDQLGLVADSQDAKTKLWQWSNGIMSAVVQSIAAGDNDAQLEAVSHELTTLQEQTPELLDALLASVVTTADDSSVISPFGMNAMAALLNQGGLWATAALTSGLRFHSKKRSGSKRADSEAKCVSAFRGVLKTLQESYARLETEVGRLQVTSGSTAGGSIKAAPQHLDAARAKVDQLVQASYTTLQSRLSNMFRDRAALLRLALQK